jgi:hypothetical protein
MKMVFVSLHESASGGRFAADRCAAANVRYW